MRIELTCRRHHGFFCASPPLPFISRTRFQCLGVRREAAKTTIHIPDLMDAVAGKPITDDSPDHGGLESRFSGTGSGVWRRRPEPPRGPRRTHHQLRHQRPEPHESPATVRHGTPFSRAPTMITRLIRVSIQCFMELVEDGQNNRTNSV
nr:uncharacterized protein LOC127302070 [Lolium perenne]